MSTAKHTPGPWAYIPQTDSVYSDIENKFKMPPGDNFVCELGLKNMEANARLIAAAPDMYDALRQWKAAEETGDNLEMINAISARDEVLARLEAE